VEVKLEEDDFREQCCHFYLVVTSITFIIIVIIIIIIYFQFHFSVHKVISNQVFVDLLNLFQSQQDF